MHSPLQTMILVRSHFPKVRDEVQRTLSDFGQVQLHAEAADIQTAISVAEFFVDKEQKAAYKKITSGLIQNNQGHKIPKVVIEIVQHSSKPAPQKKYRQATEDTYPDHKNRRQFQKQPYSRHQQSHKIPADAKIQRKQYRIREPDSPRPRSKQSQ